MSGVVSALLHRLAAKRPLFREPTRLYIVYTGRVVHAWVPICRRTASEASLQPAKETFVR
jgi:hypothetical protein